MFNPQFWPHAGLSISVGHMRLCWATDDMLAALAELAAEGEQPPQEHPFHSEWSLASPVERARWVLQQQWKHRGNVTEGVLNFQLAVLYKDEPVGLQIARSVDWQTTRVAETGAWLGHKYQRQGWGTQMRALICELLFNGFDALEVHSASFVDNHGAIGVSRKLGFSPNGTVWADRAGERVEVERFRLPKEKWAQRRLEAFPAPVRMEGVEKVREMWAL